MTMTPTEILTDYRHAADRKKQIGILADLNCCHRNEIIRILREQGEALEGIRMTKAILVPADDGATDAPMPSPPPLAGDDFPDPPAAETQQDDENRCADAAEIEPPTVLTAGRLVEFIKRTHINPDTPVMISANGPAMRVTAIFSETAQDGSAELILDYQ